MINIYSQSTNNSILKNICQVKQENHKSKKKVNINLVQYLWLAYNQDKIDQVLLLSIGYL
jgi:hypothetical protein